MKWTREHQIFGGLFIQNNLKHLAKDNDTWSGNLKVFAWYISSADTLGGRYKFPPEINKAKTLHHAPFPARSSLLES